MRQAIKLICEIWAVWLVGLIATIMLLIRTEENADEAVKEYRPALLVAWPILLMRELAKLVRKAWKWVWWHMTREG